MKKLTRYVVSTALVLVVFFNNLPNALACGPYKLAPSFSLNTHADFPLGEFTDGKTGIVPDSFDNMALFVFYRQLNRLSLTVEEQKQVVEAMETQIFYRHGRYLSSGFDPDEYDANGERTTPNYFDRWAAARAKITNEKRDVETEMRIADDYNYFTNCLPDAFNNATKTLEARAAKYGNSEHLKEWLKGQDAVFANCSGASGLPEALGENFPEWLREDREYQIAAAQFYTGDFAAAREKFEKIALDENSVWKPAAKFVAARTLIRQASFVEVPEDEAEKAQAEKLRKEFLQKASEKLQNILSDNSMNEFHRSAHRLLGLVKYRMIPDERRRELADGLAKSGENPNIYNDLTDYEWLLGYVYEQAHTKGSAIDAQEAEKAGGQYDYNYVLKLRDVPAEMRPNDLTDWILTYKAADGFRHAFEKWKETGKAQWYVAAITKAEANGAQTAEILSEADKLKGSAAYPTVLYHQVRLLLETGKRAEARQKMDEAIAKYLKNLPLSSQNKFFAQRLTVSENLDDFLRYAQRKPVLFDWDENDREEGTSLKDQEYLKDWEKRPMFDMDSVAFFNEKMPLTVLRQAALSPELPNHLKRFLVIAVWTRAFILKNQAIEREFTPLMSRYAVEFSPYFSKYAAASGIANREAAALVAVLRYPVIQPYVPVGFGRENSLPKEIDSNRGNWWCAEEQTDEDRGRYNVYPFYYPSDYPNFLTAEQTAGATRERKQLIALGHSATVLARRAVEFAAQNPNHPQTPEILHLAVRATRYGCTDEETGKYSKQAFDFLHKRFPNSAWTKETPYWFS